MVPLSCVGSFRHYGPSANVSSKMQGCSNWPPAAPAE